ncbi:MAG: sugar nucleotide-binding protein [Planctomycetota bacterium]|nr:sugar nucleotide-binding protein [Planctomycetota bacterium]
MRLLITGGSSYLGRHLVPEAYSQDQFQLGHTFFKGEPALSRGALRVDLSDFDRRQELFESFRPEVMIHTVGSERAGLELALSSARHFCELAQSSKCRFILVSSDVVFDGKKGHYAETDPTQPLHDYGRMKVETEHYASSVDNHAIVRCSLIYGRQRADHFSQWMKKSLSAGKTLGLFSDQIRNPVWAVTLSQALLELVTHDYRGVLHVGGQDAVSREDLGRLLLKHWKIDDKGLIQSTISDPNRWPRNLSLNLELSESILKTPLFGVREILNESKSNE